MTITVNDLSVDRVELEEFLDGVYDAGNMVDLTEIHFVNMTLKKGSPLIGFGDSRRKYGEQEEALSEEVFLAHTLEGI